MAFLALVDAPLSSETMKFPVFSLLTGNFETETSSLVTAPSSEESGANSLRNGLIASISPSPKDRWLANADVVFDSDGLDHGRREVGIGAFRPSRHLGCRLPRRRCPPPRRCPVVLCEINPSSSFALPAQARPR